MTKDTYIVCREVEYMNKGFIAGHLPVSDKQSEALFEAQRILESQFMANMPIIVLLHEAPVGALHVANNVSLVPPKIFDKLEDIDCFLVNTPFCTVFNSDFLEIYDTLTSNPDLLTNMNNNTYIIGCTNAA